MSRQLESTSPSCNGYEEQVSSQQPSSPLSPGIETANPSVAGPLKEDIEFCMRLLSEEVTTPQNTIFDDESGRNFYRMLWDQSEVGLLMGLHPLLMPSVQEQYLKQKESRDHFQYLEHVVDGYNDLWINAEPICGPKPKPDHARGLCESFLSDNQRRKLKTKSNGPSPYTMRDNMWFPYLTAEVKRAGEGLLAADRQNMHSVCIASRALVCLSQAANQPEKLHRRVLGFSISHDLDHVSIYVHYPEINQGKVAYYRWKLADYISIWEHKWTCYRFVENLDRVFLLIHIGLLKELLEEIPDSQEFPSGVDSYEANMGSGPESGLDVQRSLQNMIEILQQQVKEAKTREANLLAEKEQLRADLHAQMEKLTVDFYAKFEEQAAKSKQEADERVERLLASN
ncbi:hypothetical protein UA08_03304 [Talaromyces atroroseus]|uniref:DUF7924 domain-containing protein n=1 Tax=Talaromyces atroroseus TaxID=1441469 RepID=A0A225AN36_TALAT|nr:hypothetical protein UA08_03304 [Talaromyces atroroseus]OKL60863.1 hypothetical protein UA08_03304 [Talaromyces atroroseus]